ncbi:MAG: hypothetical protein FWE52_00480 [Alphaproteobacteria bacterium]|nr:hypothetical protein [Alphaproteobacteria bacterium]
MKKILFFSIFTFMFTAANAFQLQSQRDLGRDDARNQNVVVQCTTAGGQVSSQTCHLRRHAKCTNNRDGTKNCNAWNPWHDVRNPGGQFADWRDAATACCRAKGLR